MFVPSANGEKIAQLEASGSFQETSSNPSGSWRRKLNLDSGNSEAVRYDSTI